MGVGSPFFFSLTPWQSRQAFCFWVTGRKSSTAWGIRRGCRHIEDAPLREAEARVGDGGGRGGSGRWRRRGGGAARGEHRSQGHEDGGSLQALTLPHALVTLTAHFLKSVCLEIGHVASSVTLLMKTPSSNHGTNTSPRGMRLRPPVSMRAFTLPRRDSTQGRSACLRPRASASLACMKRSASGTALLSSATRRVMVPECQCSRTRPVQSHRS